MWLPGRRLPRNVGALPTANGRCHTLMPSRGAMLASAVLVHCVLSAGHRSPAPAAQRRRISSQRARRSGSVPLATARPALSTMIWSARRRAARRCETTRRWRRAARPAASHSSALGLHVERAGQVVEDQQLRLAHEHARRRGALHLPAGQPHARAARPGVASPAPAPPRRAPARPPRIAAGRSTVARAGRAGCCRAASR